MERLIDKDKLIVEYDKAHEGPPGAARKLIEEAETVDAIPVNWIIKFKNSFKSGTFMDPVEVIKFMLEVWKEDGN